MTELVSARIEKNISNEIVKLAKERKLGKTIILRQVIERGLADFRLEQSLELYRKGKITLWKAADIAYMNIWQFLEEVKKERIPVKYSLEDAQEDVRQVFG